MAGIRPDSDGDLMAGDKVSAADAQATHAAQQDTYTVAGSVTWRTADILPAPPNP
jgi:hypothetical protein